MTVLIFRADGQTFATTSWTATPVSETEMKIVFLGEEAPRYFLMSMDEFLSLKVGDIIDLRTW